MAAVQTTLSSTTTSRGKKRTLALSNGDEIDLTKANGIEANSEVVEAMRLRILELENQLSEQEPAAKRAKTSATPAMSAVPAAATSKADEKKHKIQVKKIFDRLKKECKSPALKFQGTSKQIKIDEVYEHAEFEALFNGQGTLIQPTPQNKPKSVVTIIHFNSAQVSAFFGDAMKELKGTMWSRGGGPSFSKSVKLGTCDVQISSLELSYSKTGMKCALKFEVEQLDGHDDCWKKYLW
ncbi:hypothetical protein M422DRAFT_25416 [Sphaerobolus stellatus SS14]|nr:hypothetical protein M422DRAFT_25416 [Sphaerobolus stellatus SS14]